MRVQQLALRAHGEDQELRFHDRLTVITGVPVEDRQGLVEVLLGALSGDPTVASELAYVDSQGRRVTVEQNAEGAFYCLYDDGTPALGPAPALSMSVQQLFALMYVDGRQLGLAADGPREPTELSEARAALAALTDQLQAARVVKDAADAMRVELVAIEVEIRQIESGRAKRKYAQLLMELETLKIERAALAATSAEAEADRALAARLSLIRPLAGRWRAASIRRDEELRRFGGHVRLDPAALAGALTLPDRVPPKLDILVESLVAAEAQRATLSAKLAGLMATHLKSPSHPDVARLARADQDRVWSVARRAQESSERLERESIAVGGLAAEGEAPALVREIESAHSAVEAAHDTIEKRRFGAMAAAGGVALGAVALPLAPVIAPLALAGAASAAYWAVLAPRQQLAEARVWEADTLVRAGVPSYLAFHLRRMEAMKDPALRRELEHASTDHRRDCGVASAGRRHGPAVALKLENEVRAYAASVEALEGLGDDVDRTRRRLTESIEPAVEKAREALMAVCRPFGIESPVLAADLVRQLADVARFARLQCALEEAEAREAEARAPLEDVVTHAGLAEGPVGVRVQQFEGWAQAAALRVRYRTLARSPRDLDREIDRLAVLTRSEYRPEYGATFNPADAKEPDPGELERRRDMTAMAYQTASQLVPDVARIADRKSAVERRVAVLEEEFGETGVPSANKMAELERYLSDRSATLEACGPAREVLPMIFDDAFSTLRADAKWAMLDIIDRLSAASQVIYLTDDPEVAVWARRRSATGAVGHEDPLALAV